MKEFDWCSEEDSVSVMKLGCFGEQQCVSTGNTLKAPQRRLCFQDEGGCSLWGRITTTAASSERE